MVATKDFGVNVTSLRTLGGVSRFEVLTLNAQTELG